MATRKPLVIVSGVTQQIADADAISANGGVQRGTAGALSLGTDANTTSLNLGTNAALTAMAIGTGMGTGDTIQIGGGGIGGSLTQIMGDLQVDGVQTFVGGSTFNQDATFEGNVTFGNATTDLVSFVSRVGPLANPNINFVKEVNHIIRVDTSTTAATGGGSITVRSGAGNTSGAGGNAFYEAGAGGATGAGGNASLQAGAGGATSGAGGNSYVYGGDATSGAAGSASVLGGNSAAGAGGGASVTGGNGTGAAGGSVTLDGGTGTTKGSVLVGTNNAVGVTLGNAADGTNVRLGAGFEEFANGASAAVSPAGEGRLRYNNGTSSFQVSINGGAYTDLATGGAESLAATLAVGNTTGGNDIIFSSGDDIQAAGDGVAFNIAYSAAATASAGGTLSVTAQQGNGANAGGGLAASAGAGGATGAGGVATVAGGAGGATSGAGGNARLTGGVATTSGTGGSALVAGGNSPVSGAGGAVSITGGNGTGAAGGNVSIDGGTGTTKGGINIGTTNTGTITLGNITDNPVIQLVGSGTKILSGNVQVSGTLRLAEQVGDPVAVGNTGFVYTKDVAGVTQLFYEADNGTVSQLTPPTASPNLATVLATGNTTGGTSIDFTAGDDLVIADNATGVFKIREGATNDYLSITTSNGSESMSFGNVTINPAYSFLGTGLVTVGGDVASSKDGTNFQIAFSAAATASNGGRAQLVGQTAAATFTGGVSQVVGGAGGASSGATPGAQGGSGRAVGGSGGAGSVTAAGGVGGSASIIAGVGGNAAGAFADGAGGNANILAGNSGTGGTGAVGGSVIIDAGVGSSGVNGSIEIGTGTLSTAIATLIRLGTNMQWDYNASRYLGMADAPAETVGGAAGFFAGYGGDSAGAAAGGAGGSLSLDAGGGGLGSGAFAPGDGGGVSITAGSGNTGGTGNSAGGAIAITAGNSQGTANAGIVEIAGGSASGSGDGGSVYIYGSPSASGTDGDASIDGAAGGRVLLGTDPFGVGRTASILIGNTLTNPTTTFQGTGTVSLTGANKELRLMGSGAGTGGGFLTMFESTDPTTPADTGALYTKDVAGATQLFYREASAGTVHQLTPAGASASNAVIITGLTTTGVTTGHAVYVSAASTVVAADANGTAAQARCFGFYEGTSGSVKVAGVVTPVFTTAPSVGDAIYLSLVAGEVTPTAPSGSGEYVAEVGIALTTTTMLIQVKTVIAL
jgi:hypothetical protein